MAYFSNGTEGMLWMEGNCWQCVHQDSCPVMLLQELWNYEQHSDPTKKQALDILLPSDEDDDPKDCPMFLPKVNAPDPELILPDQALAGPSPWEVP